MYELTKNKRESLFKRFIQLFVVRCNKCGWLILRKNAIRGKPIIVKKEEGRVYDSHFIWVTKKYKQDIYYCVAHYEK